MSENTIEKSIISIIADVSGFDEEEINLDTKLADELEIDSIKAIEITVAIEKKFKISVRDEDVPNITTVRSAIELAKNLLDQKNQANENK
jgi:acyl carrier protein